MRTQPTSVALNLSTGEGDLRDHPWDWVIMAICLLAGIAGLKLMPQIEYWTQTAAIKDAPRSIGIIIKEQGAVRQRSEGALAWYDLGERESLVSSGDTVFTGTNGIAKLRLQSEESSATIFPNSLVIIRPNAVVERHSSTWWSKLRAAVKTKPLEQSIDLQKGQVRVQLPKSAGIRIKTQKGDLRLESISDSSSVVIAIDPTSKDGNVRLSTDSASRVKIRSTESANDALKNSDVELLSNNTAVLGNEALPVVQNFSLEALTPKNNETIFIQQNPPDAPSIINFSWQSIGELSKDSKLTVVVEGSSKIRQQTDPSHTSLTIPVPPGAYRWHAVLESTGKDPITTHWNEFKVVPLIPPRILGPSKEGIITTTRNKERIVLSWQPLSREVQYEVELKSEKYNFTQETDSATLNLELPLGQYSWKIRSLLSDGRSSEWSPLSQFSIAAPIIAPPLPKLVVAPSSISTRLKSADELEKVPAFLEWNPIDEAKEYQVTVYDGTRLVLMKTVEQPKFELVLDSMSRKYGYEVTAVLKSGKQIKSKRVPLLIELVPPVASTPRPKAIVAARTDVLLTWERTLLTKNYQLQISKDPSFSRQMVSKMLYNNFYTFTPKSVGTFYWRIRSRNGKNESQWSQSASFISIE